MGEVPYNLPPDKKTDEIEKGEGRDQGIKFKIKSFAWDWDGALERLFKKLFKREGPK
jgi:hypothetical protein